MSFAPLSFAPLAALLRRHTARARPSPETIQTARETFASIAEKSADLRPIHTSSLDGVTFPKQENSLHEIVLALTGDALSLRINDSAVFSAPLFAMERKAAEAQEFSEAALGFLSGEWRLLVFRSDEDFRSELQQNFRGGDGWLTRAGYRASGRLPPGEGDVWKLRNR